MTRFKVFGGTRKVISILLGLTFLLYCPTAMVVAQESTPAHHHHHTVNLDLSSQAATASARRINADQQVNIQVGNTVQTVSAGTKLTPAELVAVRQVMSTGAQSIQLGSLGNAVGGSLNIGARLNQHLGSLVIPQGVIVVDNFAKTTALNLTGNLVNNGTLYAVSTGGASIALINAANITNGQGALLTTVLPQAGLAGLVNPVAHLDLVLNALNNIVNYGLISSSGHITATAGGSIINALPAGTTGAAPVMQALNNVNLTASNIVNAGLITSATANINLASVNNSRLLVNNLSGQMQALAGAINLRSSNFSGTAPISVTGGDFLSKSLNVFGDHGNITIEANKVTGIINTTGCNIAVSIDSGDAWIGNITAYGDPLFTATGSYAISGSVGGAGQPLTVVAGQNITCSSCSIDTSSASSSGGNILLAAGAGWTWNDPGHTTLSFSQASGTGGSINLTGISTFDSSSHSTTASYAGGNVTLVAYGGSINVPVAVTTNGSLSGTNGSFTAIANGNITLGAVNSAGTTVTGSGAAPPASTGAGGNISIYTATPTGLTTVASTGSVLSSTLTASTNYANASVITGTLTASNGGNITILAGNNITITGGVSSLNNSQAGYTAPGGAIIMAAGIAPGSSAGDITITGTGSTSGETNNNMWHTLGLTTLAQTSGFQIGTDIIQQLTNQASGSDPTAGANEELNSGSTVPVEIVVPAGTILYKLRPTGWGNPSIYTPYWFTYGDLTSLLGGGSANIGSNAALPPSQVTGITSYDIWAITATTQSTVFKSGMAPAVITSSGQYEDGGAIQTLVPNRNLWGPAINVGTLAAGAQTIRSSSVFATGNVSLVSKGNINVSSGSTASSIFGGNVFTCAGCVPTVNNGVISISSSNPSTNGGKISLFNGASGMVAAWGGDITLVARNGSSNPGNIAASTTALFTFPTSGPTGTFYGPPVTGGGNILVLADGANPALPPLFSITLGNIIANGGTSGTSKFTLATTSPLGAASINILNGSITNGLTMDTSFASLRAASAQTGAITSIGGPIVIVAGQDFSSNSGDLTSYDTGSITVVAGRDLSTGGDYVYTSNSTGYAGSGGFITLAAGVLDSTGDLTVTTGTGPNNLLSTANSNFNNVWHTLGLTTSAQSLLVGQDLLAALTAAGNPNPAAAAKEQLNSGEAVPNEITVPLGTTLYKLSPTGTTASAFTPYWFTLDQVNNLLAHPSEIANIAALPPSQRSTSYDIFSITATATATATGPNQTLPTVFQAAMAPAVITSTGEFEDAGAVQTLVPNRSLWSPATFVGTFNAGAQVVRKSSVFATGYVNLVAGGNISVNSAAASSSFLGSSIFGGSVLTCAGCSSNINGGSLNVTSSATPGGGSINLFTTGAPGTVAAWGGNVTMVSRGDTVHTAGIGTVVTTSPVYTFPSFGPTTSTYGPPLTGTGNILVLSDGALALPSAATISLGALSASGGGAAGIGNITLVTGSPLGSTAINLSTGLTTNAFAADLSSALPFHSISTSAVTSFGGAILVCSGYNYNSNDFDLTSSNSGSITVLAHDDISVGGVYVFNNSSNLTTATGSGGFITLVAGVNPDPGLGNLTITAGSGGIPVGSSNATWHTLGLTISANTTGFTVGNDLISQIMAGSATITYSQALQWANGFLNSSSTIPAEVIVTPGTTLYKLVPTNGGTTPPRSSGYWITQDVLNGLLQFPALIPYALGLPPSTQVTKYDIWKITATGTPTVFTSVIAPAVSTSTGIMQTNFDGSTVQTYVPNGTLWSPASPYGTVSFTNTFAFPSTVFATGNVNLVASGNINVSGTFVFGNNVLMSAGCQPTVNNGIVTLPTIGVHGGGSINNNPGSGVSIGAWGGNMSLIARGGNNPTTAGTVTAYDISTYPSYGASVYPYGPTSGTGSILVLADGTPATDLSIALEAITATSVGASNAGSIYLYTSAPAQPGTGYYAQINLNTGAPTNLFQPSVSSLVGASINTNDIINLGGSINVWAGNNYIFDSSFIYSSSGTVRITTGTAPPNTGVFTFWHPLNIISGGDIDIIGPVVFTPMPTGCEDCSSVVMVAGANNVIQVGYELFEIFGNTPGATGGNINITSSSAQATINTSPTATDTSGGNVTLVALPGTASRSGTVTVHNEGTGYSILTAGQQTSATQVQNGDITIVAGGTGYTSYNGYSIAIDSLSTGSSTTGGNGGGGAVTLETVNPNLSTILNVPPTVLIADNTVIGSFIGGIPVQGAISAGNISTAGAPVLIFAGSNTYSTGQYSILAGDITTSPAATSGVAGGNVSVITGIAGYAAGANNSYNAGIGSITTTGSTLSPGGTVLLSSLDSITVNGVTTGGGGFNGGQVMMIAGDSATGQHTAGNIFVQTAIDTHSTTSGGASVIIISTGSSGEIQTATNTGFNIDTHGSSGGAGGSIAISSSAGTILLNDVNTQATGTGAFGNHGGDVLLTTGLTGSNVIQTHSIDTSTANALYDAGQIWVSLTPTSSTNIIPANTVQNQFATREAYPVVISDTAPFAIDGGTYEVEFMPSNISANQTGDIQFFSPGGFLSIADTQNAVNLQVSLVNTSSIVPDTKLIVPIISRSVFAITGNWHGSSTIQIPASSDAGNPALAFFSGQGITLGGSLAQGRDPIGFGAISEGAIFSISAIGSSAGNVAINTFTHDVNDNDSIGNVIVCAGSTASPGFTFSGIQWGGPGVVNIQMAGTQVSSQSYSVATDFGTISVESSSNIYAPTYITLRGAQITAGDIATHITLTTSNLALISTGGQIGINSDAPVFTNAPYISVQAAGVVGHIADVFVKDTQSANRTVVVTGSTSDGSFNFYESALHATVVLGTPGGSQDISAATGITVQEYSISRGAIDFLDIEGNVTATGSTITIALMSAPSNDIGQSKFSFNTGTLSGLSANSITLTVANGSIGNIAVPLNINASNLNVTPGPGATYVSITNAGTAALPHLPTQVRNLFYSNTGSISLQSDITVDGGRISLTTTGAISDAGGYILAAPGGVILQTTNGDIGDYASSHPVLISSPSITANARGAGTNVFIQNDQTTDIGRASQANGGNFRLHTTAGDITDNAGNVITADLIELVAEAGSIGSVGSLSGARIPAAPIITAASEVETQGWTTGTLTSDIYILNNFPAAVTPRTLTISDTTAAANLRNYWFSNTGGITLGSPISSSATGGTITISTTGTTSGDITNDSVGNLLTALGSVTLTTSNGSIGSSDTSNNIYINSPQLTASAGGNNSNVYIWSETDVDIVGTSQAGDTLAGHVRGIFSLNLFPGGDITDTNLLLVSANEIDLTTTNGSIKAGVLGHYAVNVPFPVNAPTIACNTSAAPTNDVYVADSQSVDISPTSSSAAGGDFYLAVANGSITNTGLNVVPAGNSNTFVLWAPSGSIGSAGVPFGISAPYLIAYALNNVYITDRESVSLQPASGFPIQAASGAKGTFLLYTSPITSTPADINIGSNLSVSGATWILIANRNISNTGNYGINTSSSTGNGGNILLIAGANELYRAPWRSMFSLGQNSSSYSSGGIITLSRATSGNLLDSSSTATNGSGGTITLVALSQLGTPTTGGTILLNSSGGDTMRSMGKGTGVNGEINVVAGGTPGAYSMSFIGNIVSGSSTSGGSGGGGAITLETSDVNALLQTKSIFISSTGTVGSFLGGTPVDGAVNVTGYISTPGANVTIMTGGNLSDPSANAISVNDITTTPLQGAGGDVNIISGTAGFNASAGYNISTGSLTTSGASGAVGGSVLVSALESITANAVTTAGGQVLMITGYSGVTPSFADITVGAGINTSSSVGSGGNVILVSTSNGRIQRAPSVGFDINTSTTSDAFTSHGGSVVVSSANNTIYLYDVDTQSYSPTGGDGGDVFLTSAGSLSPNISTHSINTSTTNVSANAGQIWAVTPSAGDIALGTTTQNRFHTPEAIPVIEGILPGPIDGSSVANQIIFTPSYLLGTTPQSGGITGFSPGGFTGISDTSGTVDIQVRLVNTTPGVTVQDNGLIVPIISTLAFTLLGQHGRSDTIEVAEPATGQTSAGLPSLAFFGDQGITIGDSQAGHNPAVLTTGEQGLFQIAAIGSSNGPAQIEITHGDYNETLTVGPTIVNAAQAALGFALMADLPGTMTVNVIGSQASSQIYTLMNTCGSIGIYANITAPKFINIDSDFDNFYGAAGKYLSSNTVSLNSYGNIGTPAQPLMLDAGNLSNVYDGIQFSNLYVVDIHGLNIAASFNTTNEFFVRTLSGDITVSFSLNPTWTGQEIDLLSAGGITVSSSIQPALLSPFGISANRINLAAVGTISINPYSSPAPSPLPIATIACNDILFLNPIANGNLTVVNNGTVTASYTSGLTGIVAFSGGITSNVSLSGAGSISAEQYVTFGDFDLNTLAVSNPIVLPLRNSFTYAKINVSQGLMSTPVIYVSRSGSVPTPPAPTTQTLATTTASIEFPVLVLPGYPPNLPSPVVVATDLTHTVTPPSAMLYGLVRELPTYGIASAKTGIAVCLADEFDANVITALTKYGVMPGNKMARGNNVSLKTGKVLFAPSKPIVVHTPAADLLIAGGSMVFASMQGPRLVVYNLHDDHAGAVQLVVGNHRTNLSMSRMAAIIDRDTTGFEGAAPDELVAYRDAVSRKIDNGTTLYLAEFSMVSALANLPIMHSLVSQQIPQRDRIMSQLYKNAAITTVLATASHPFIGRSGAFPPR